MSFFLLLLYLILAYLRPWEFYPEMESLRLPFMVGNMGLGIGVIRFAMRGGQPLTRGPELWLLITFFVMVTFSRLLAEFWIAGVIETLGTFMPTITLCCLIWLNVDTIGKLRKTAAVTVLCSMILVGFTIAAYHYGVHADKFMMTQRVGEEDAEEITILGRVRGLGSLNDPNDFSQAIVAVLPWLWPLWQRGRTLRNLCLIGLPTLLLLYGIFLTRSRGAVLALLVVALVTIRDRLTRFRIVLPLAAVAVMGVGLLAVGGTGGRDISADDESAQGRIDAWRAGIQMLKERPFTGVGYGRFADHNGGLAAHNSLVNCFAEQGFFGYICWIALLYVLFRRLTKLRESSDPEGDSGDIYRWANALRASLLGCMTAAFFLSRTYAPTVYMVFAVIMALYATSQSRDEPPDAEIGPIFAPATGVALCSIIGIYVLVRVV